MADREQCTICLESLKSPRQLPCRHSFCETCLQEYINKLAKEGMSIKKFGCPNCRTPTTSPSPGEPLSGWARQFPQFPKANDFPRHTAILKKKCGPCEYDGNIVDGSKYCADCREYICEECYSHHKRLPITRKHRVVKADEVGKVIGSSSKERCSCPWNKKLSFHCLDHKTYCCIKCKNENHANCKDVKSIVAMSESLRLLEEIESTLGRMNRIKGNFQKIIDLSENNKSSLAIEKGNIIDSIKKIHADLRSLLSKIEDSMIEEVNTMNGKITSGLTEHVRNCETAIAEIDTTSTILKAAQSEETNDQLYISHNRCLEEMAQIEKVLHETALDMMTSELCFQPNELANSLQTVLQSFGEISTKVKKNVFTLRLPEVKLRYRNAKQLKSVRVPVPDPCHLTGVAVLPNDCCVVVNYNQSVLMFDCNDQQTSSLSMPSAWDVCVTAKNEVAVTTTSQRKIHFLSTDNDLVCTRTISTGRWCDGIAYCVMTRELVITTCYPPSVQILTLTGDVVKIIEKDGGQLFSVGTYYVAVNDTGDMLYVSDYYRGVIGVDRNGHVKFIYIDVKYPRGISTDGDGNIYVCGYDSSDVHQLSPDGSRIQILLSVTDGSRKPYGLLFSRRNDNILVSCDQSQNILVYKMQ